MSSHPYQTARFTLHGLCFLLELFYDQDAEAPWDGEEGHGPVSDWTSRSKRPGERVLNTSHNRSRYYDVAGATRIAKRDSWGLSDASRQKLTTELGRDPTRGEILARAVEEDFERLQAWCRDIWHYAGVAVTVLDVAGEPTHLAKSLWRVESDQDDHIQETAHGIAEELAAEVGQGNTVSLMLKHRACVQQVRQ